MWPGLKIIELVTDVGRSSPVWNKYIYIYIITSKRRHFDIITSKWRRFGVITTLLLRHNVKSKLSAYINVARWSQTSTFSVIIVLTVSLPRCSMERQQTLGVEWCPRCCQVNQWSWWRHQMEAFSALLALCVGNSSVPGEFPTQRPVTRSFDVAFDLHLNIRLSKQSRG